ncbi:MAG: tRNA adenosine(34) deaminase TadA [Candidatus Nanopelagicales bacterium]|nr:tRNA adenosine(34) deaminase TadA [Candidatus Nanopelagicales bacterium]MCU0298759.1 tRNA adenosine(34) deaminase TadA [Candidatus Nanopelagicales bacterium]
MTPEAALALALDRAKQPDLEMPIAAVVVTADGSIVGTGVNRREAQHDPTAHAEILALRQAGATLGDWRLSGCTLAVTLEPCTMCAGALVLARIERLVFGAFDDKAGAVGGLWDVVRDPRLNHEVEVVGGVLEEQCSTLLSDFFRRRR